MTTTNDEQTALRRLLERLREKVRCDERKRKGTLHPELYIRSDTALEAEVLVPVIERLLNAEPCVWTEDSWHGYWDTECGEPFTFNNDGTPHRNHFRFCPGCGKRIKAEPKDNEP